jgi:mannose/fructose/N-acetylgalactosamine-specific phosphotransferase system component IIC
MGHLADSLNDVSRAIQLALGPVFLLTAIAGMLNVMAGRLARIIDRGRALTEGQVQHVAAAAETLRRELESLERRRHLASAAITSCTFAALLVCTVIVTLFLEVILEVRLKWLIAMLFTTGTIALVVGLALFLREVHLATRSIRIPSVAQAGRPKR